MKRLEQSGERIPIPVEPAGPAHPQYQDIDRTLRRLRRLSRVMDTRFRIPGTSIRLGIDPIIGLVPGIGDWIGAGISLYPVFVARRLGVPRRTLGRMGFNVLIEATVGAIPLIGDVFDVAFKANVRNVDLLESALVKQGRLEVTKSTAPR